MVDQPDPARNSDVESDDNQNGTYGRADHATIINIEETIINPIEAADEPAKKTRDWYDETQLIFLILTFFAASAAAAFTCWLAIRTQDIADDSHWVDC